MSFSFKLRYLYRAWRYRLKLDPAEIKAILVNLAPGDVAIDIGAHKGAYTYWLQKRVSDSGRVVLLAAGGNGRARISCCWGGMAA